jgi:hypothetical protein
MGICVRSKARNLAAGPLEFASLEVPPDGSMGVDDPDDVESREIEVMVLDGSTLELNGPYWQWTRVVAGKTVTRRLTEPQARLYQEWIANRRRLTRTIAEMEKLSQQAGEILLRDRDAGPARRAPTQPPPG